TVRAKEMVLAHNFVEAAGPELIGKRAWRGAIKPRCGEETCPSRFWPRGHRVDLSPPSTTDSGANYPPNTTDICWPLRDTLMRHSGLWFFVARSRSLVCAILVPLTFNTISPR